jgi:hypothetical protein
MRSKPAPKTFALRFGRTDGKVHLKRQQPFEGRVTWLFLV